MMLDQVPLSIESCPSDGPTVRSSRMFTGAGSAPARRTIARSVASSIVKEPVIWACPPEIRSWITGAEWTMPSRTMARRFLTFSPVIRSKSFAPWALNLMDTCGSPKRSPIWTLAFSRASPVRSDLFLRRIGFCDRRPEALSIRDS